MSDETELTIMRWVAFVAIAAVVLSTALAVWKLISSEMI